MSLWQFSAAVLGVQRANSPPDEEGGSIPPSVADFEAALQSSLVN